MEQTGLKTDNFRLFIELISNWLTRNKLPSTIFLGLKISIEAMPFIFLNVSFCGASPSRTGISYFSASIIAVTNSSSPRNVDQEINRLECDHKHTPVINLSPKRLRWIDDEGIVDRS